MKTMKQSDQFRRIHALFGDKSDNVINVVDSSSDPKCGVHRKRLNSVESNPSDAKINYRNKRESFDATKKSHLDKSDLLGRRQSFTEGYGELTRADRNRKRNSWNASMFRSIEHPSAFPSLLRSDTINRNEELALSDARNNKVNLVRRSSMSALNGNRPKAVNMNKRQSFGSNLYLRTDSFGNLNLVRRDSLGTRNLNRSITSFRRGESAPRDYVSDRTNATSPKVVNERASILRKSSVDDVDKSKLTKENLHRHVRILENENVGNHKSRRKSEDSVDDYIKFRRMSMDSLDLRRSSIDFAENALSELSLNSTEKNENGRPHFVAVTTLEDVQAVRCAEFHPSGRIYAVGSNSKTFRICEYPSLSEVREEHTTYQPTVLFKRTKHHKGSIYCMGWAPDGELVATGSNDKTIKLMRYDDIKKQLEGREIELTMHDGTIRDLCFLEDSTNKASLLISGGAGDCKIYVTDCGTATPFQALSGHGGHILSLYNWGGAMFVSGSQDKTIRFWDLRTRGCVNTITPATTPGSRQGSPVAAVCVDPSGRLLVSGHEDSSCVLYDIRGNRPIQCFKPHSADIRSIRFSPSAYYLLTAGYDNKLVLTDLQGDLTLPLPSVVVAQHADKVISGRWHPTDFSFLSTSADKTATLWALPPL